MGNEKVSHKRTIYKGLGIVAPCLVGWLIDQACGIYAFTYIGAAFSVCELFERAANRFAMFWTQTSCPKWIAREPLPELDEFEAESAAT